MSPPSVLDQFGHEGRAVHQRRVTVSQGTEEVHAVAVDEQNLGEIDGQSPPRAERPLAGARLISSTQGPPIWPSALRVPAARSSTILSIG
jgi:hypothetical protein